MLNNACEVCLVKRNNCPDTFTFKRSYVTEPWYHFRFFRRFDFHIFLFVRCANLAPVMMHCKHNVPHNMKQFWHVFHFVRHIVRFLTQENGYSSMMAASSSR